MPSVRSRVPSVRQSAILARHYENLFGSFSRNLRPVRRRLLRMIRPRPRRLLDLASGPGEAAVDFAKLGLRVIAIDGNPHFVRMAKERASENRVALEARRGDMRRFRLRKPVDLVTCNFDALNHLPRRSDLRPTLACVRRALVPGGHFFFDVNTPRALAEVWPRWSGILETPGWVVISKDAYDLRRKQALFHVTWYLQEERSERYRKVIESHREVAWPRPELEQAVRDAGFSIVKRWDLAELLPKETPRRRDFYLVRLA